MTYFLRHCIYNHIMTGSLAKFEHLVTLHTALFLFFAFGTVPSRAFHSLTKYRMMVSIPVKLLHVM